MYSPLCPLYTLLEIQGVAGGSHGCANETEMRSTPAGHLYTTPDTVALGNQALDNVKGDQICRLRLASKAGAAMPTAESASM